jgi:hypothetical protein
MLKNRFAVALAFAGLVGFAACADGDDDVIIEEPVIEEPMNEPIVDPAPVLDDTMYMDTMMMDTTGI